VVEPNNAWLAHRPIRLIAEFPSRGNGGTRTTGRISSGPGAGLTGAGEGETGHTLSIRARQLTSQAWKEEVGWVGAATVPFDGIILPDPGVFLRVGFFHLRAGGARLQRLVFPPWSSED